MLATAIAVLCDLIRLFQVFDCCCAPSISRADGFMGVPVRAAESKSECRSDRASDCGRSHIVFAVLWLGSCLLISSADAEASSTSARSAHCRAWYSM